MTAASIGPDTDAQARWNARHSNRVHAFAPNPLAEQILAADPPDGPVLELAGGVSGSALLLAAASRQTTVVDISIVALAALAAEADRRGLAGRLELVHDDLVRYCPEPDRFAAVLCSLYWDPIAFARGHRAVAPGGLLAWEALTATPGSQSAWRLAPGEPATLLPAWFDLVDVADTDGPHATRRLLARRSRTVPDVPSHGRAA